MQILCYIDLLKVLQLECLSILFPNILALSQAIEVENEMHQLFISFIIVEGDDWDSIVKLIAKRVNSVVDYDKIF